MLIYFKLHPANSFPSKKARDFQGKSLAKTHNYNQSLFEEKRCKISEIVSPILPYMPAISLDISIAVSHRVQEFTVTLVCLIEEIFIPYTDIIERLV